MRGLTERVQDVVGGSSRSDVALATGLVIAALMVLVVVAALAVAAMKLL